MSARATKEETGAESVNEVRLVGRISQQPEERVLPSGDSLWTFRIVLTRTGERGRSRRCVDSLECAVWAGRVRRSVAGWGAGDIVEVTGAVRRRFFRAGGAAASRVEVEVTGGRVIRRAASG
ncbi:MAG: single-strand binding protein/Primosomal replication protein n [Nocardioides sp.]|nr:single-strand binding protein/Primosomal replication protein n [Nocardioides sp.]